MHSTEICVWQTFTRGPVTTFFQSFQLYLITVIDKFVQLSWTQLRCHCFVLPVIPMLRTLLRPVTPEEVHHTHTKIQIIIDWFY